MPSLVSNAVAVSLKDDGCVGSAAAALKESITREARVGTTIAFTLVDMGRRQSPRGRINIRGRGLTLRARFGSIAEGKIMMSSAHSNAQRNTYRSEKQEQQGAKLNGTYDHEAHRRIPQNDSPKTPYPPGCRRKLSPGFKDKYRESKDIYNTEHKNF